MADNVVTIDQAECVTIALALVPDSILQAMSSGLGVLINTLTAYEAIIDARLATLNYLMAPLLAKKAALQSLIASYQQYLLLFNQGIISQCVAIGATTQIIQEAIQPYVDGLNRYLDLINITARLQLEFEDLKYKIDAYIGLLKTVKLRVDGLIQLRQSVIMSATTNPLGAFKGT